MWRLRRSGIGRTLLAVRDNEMTASAYTISPTRAKLIAFAVSGGIGALAGGLLVPATGSLIGTPASISDKEFHTLLPLRKIHLTLLFQIQLLKYKGSFLLKAMMN